MISLLPSQQLHFQATAFPSYHHGFIYINVRLNGEAMCMCASIQIIVFGKDKRKFLSLMESLALNVLTRLAFVTWKEEPEKGVCQYL